MPLVSGYPVDFSDLQTIDGAKNRGGYCLVADVKALLYTIVNDPVLLSNTTLIETLIADNSQDIDRALELLYVTPISGTTALEHVRFIVKYLALSDLITLSAGNAPNVEAVHMTASVHRETGSQRLDDLVSGVSQLFDAVTRPGGERPAFPQSKAAQWNPDADNGLPAQPSQLTGPLFGVRVDPFGVSDDWIK